MQSLGNCATVIGDSFFCLGRFDGNAAAVTNGRAVSGSEQPTEALGIDSAFHQMVRETVLRALFSCVSLKGKETGTTLTLFGKCNRVGVRYC